MCPRYDNTVLGWSDDMGLCVLDTVLRQLCKHCLLHHKQRPEGVSFEYSSAIRAQTPAAMALDDRDKVAENKANKLPGRSLPMI